MQFTFDVRPLADELTPHLAHRLLHSSHDTFNYDHLATFAASVDSATFATEFFKSAARYPNDEALLRDSLRQAPLDGLVLEFGVASGRTLRFLAEGHPGPVYGFDSFGGLPEDWRPGFAAGTFAQQPPETLPNAELVIGLFGDTLPGFLATHPGPVKFLHVDCDLYSSTVTIFQHLAPRIQRGTVIVFDEYLNYPGWREHEHKAWDEFRQRHGIAFRYAGCVPGHMQVAVAVF